ncbi:hypothetical protein C8Q80DRAFT_696201 [Daedaleopsis nitida]|nr:hypothetical protein C8Q80DRAFT_696201 [Daedaleopsis nitida]
MQHYEPVTPGRDPAAIDRRTLVGVGELATPRWARGARNDDFEFVAQERVDEVNEDETVDADRLEEDRDSDSPWTIEAIDGEQDEKEEQLMEVKPVRSFSVIEAGSPPSAFTTPPHRARKRTSEEFELDNGALVLKFSSPSTVTPGTAKDKEKARRHRSLGAGMPSQVTPKEKVKERRRDTLSVNVRHSRQGSSSSSHGESHHTRRIYNSDFSHLPPSPSSSSIQQFLKQGGNVSSSASSPLHAQPHLASNVAHSLLRGTQEGWSDLDDQTTMEALRKLDGLSGKTARARSSIGGHSRVGSSSRPGTPAKGTTQWEGIESGGSRSSKRSSIHASLSGKDKPKEGAHRVSSSLVQSAPESVADTDYVVTSGEDAHRSSPDKSTKKAGTASARSSFTPKRGSASSGTYASTPTSSRDSASLSVATSNTSVSAASGRQSSGKTRRNSAGSDISIGHGGDSTSARDRVAALVAPVDSADEGYVPPVPPLPKELSTYKSPIASPSVALPHNEVPDRSRRETFNDLPSGAQVDDPDQLAQDTVQEVELYKRSWQEALLYTVHIVHEGCGSAPQIADQPHQPTGHVFWATHPQVHVKGEAHVAEHYIKGS